MKIVVLDGYALNPGDLSWEGLERLGELTVFDRTAPEQLMARAAGAQLLLTNKTVLDAAALKGLPELRYIGVLATGYNVVATGDARRRGIPVTNVPGYGTHSVAQMAFALLLELTRRVGQHAQLVREGGWSQSRDFCFWEGRQVELSGLVMGLVGFGQIAQATAALAGAFGMKVLVHTRNPERHRALFATAGIEAVELEALFRRSDVVSLHCPLTEETRGLVSAARLEQMKQGAYLINTSRGPLVDEEALAAALAEGRLAGAGLDVLGQEPPAADNPLLQAPNCFITPHIAWASRAARERLLTIAVENVRAFLAGKPEHVVN